MAKKSQENGNKGEAIMAKWFRSKKYWAHLIKRDRQGSQPFDGVMVANDKGNIKVWFLDAKYINANKKGRFDFEDVQPDQEEAMAYAYDYIGIKSVGFFLVFEGLEDKPFFLPYKDYIAIKQRGGKSIFIRLLETMEECEGQYWRYK